MKNIKKTLTISLSFATVLFFSNCKKNNDEIKGHDYQADVAIKFINSNGDDLIAEKSISIKNLKLYYLNNNAKVDKSVLMNIYEASEGNYRLKIPLNIEETSPLTLIEYSDKSLDTLSSETLKSNNTIYINRIRLNKNIIWEKNNSNQNSLTEIIIKH